MKKTPLVLISIQFFLISVIIINGCKVDRKNAAYLQEILENLNQIKSATYFSKESSSAPYDTLVFRTRYMYVKEFNNPSDTFIGSSFIDFKQDDTSKMMWFYDGKSMTYLDWSEKTINIDSFKTTSTPFRSIGPPFFNYTRSIIKYALETQDSISIDLIDLGDSVKFSLFIHNKAIEFFGKPYAMDIKYYLPISRYDIWINKSDNLPYRYRRNMSVNTNWRECKNAKLNKTAIEDFQASNYIPSDFTISTPENRKTEKTVLVGKVAPNWILKDIDSNTIALKDLNSKIVMIQFSGIGCGPCHASIPFLKRLANEYKDQDFEIVSIETWSKNIDGMKRYYNNNNLNYKFLMSTDKVTKSYQIQSVPAFYILNKERVIQKVISGYEEGTTDKEIRDAISELI